MLFGTEIVLIPFTRTSTHMISFTSREVRSFYGRCLPPSAEILANGLRRWSPLRSYPPASPPPYAPPPMNQRIIQLSSNYSDETFRCLSRAILVPEFVAAGLRPVPKPVHFGPSEFCHSTNLRFAPVTGLGHFLALQPFAC